MKKIAAFLVITCTVCVNLLQAQKFERLHGVTKYDYSVKAELELEYTSKMFFPDRNERLQQKYRLKAPFFIQYNLNDLKFFRAEPKEFIGYEDNFLSSNYTFSDSKNQNETSAGMMQVADLFQKSESPAETTEQKLNGEIGMSPDINFSLLGLSKQLKSGNKPQFTLFISASPCPNCEQKVRGAAKYTSSDGNSLSVNEGLTLDVNLHSLGLSYGTDLTKAFIEHNLVEADKKEKDRFEDGFKIEYYKSLPKIEAIPLIDFLIVPKGTYEIPLEGYINTSTDIPETTHFKGKLKIYGDKLYRHWAGE